MSVVSVSVVSVSVVSVSVVVISDLSISEMPTCVSGCHIRSISEMSTSVVPV